MHYEMPFSSDDVRSRHYYSSFRFSVPFEETFQADLTQSNIGGQKNPNNNIRSQTRSEPKEASTPVKGSGVRKCFKHLRKIAASVKRNVKKIFHSS